MLRYLFSSNVYLTLLLGLTAVIGDFLVFHSKLYVFQAIFDNATHAFIGGISWLICCMNHRNVGASHSVREIALCSVISSVIDLDHFLAAKSFFLKDATSLKTRPPLHCSSLPIVLCTVLLIISYVYQTAYIKKLSLLILTAFASHHIRDATRRGLWLYPFGSTYPIPYIGYVGLTCVIPYFVLFLNKMIKISSTSNGNHSVINL